MRFSFAISSPQLKVFSAVCSNLVVVWLIAIFTTKDLFVLIRYVMATILAWCSYLGRRGVRETMTNFDQIGTLGQIAFAVVYYVSTKKPTRSKR